MLTETTAELKPRYFRYKLVKQSDRIEYRVLSGNDESYYTVQMRNGRAINCFCADGNKCPARHFNPAMPCKHMERANQVEQERRMQRQAAEAMQTMPEGVQKVIKQEQAKCQQVWQEAMSAPINATPQSKKWYSLAKKREQAANKALNLQRTESQRVINAAMAQATKEVA